MSELEERLRTLVAGSIDGAELDSLRPLQGGASSLTLLATLRGDPARKVVVRQAPAGIMPLGARDVLRQARIMQALQGCAGVAVPRVLFEDPGDPPEVPPLFGMEFIDGESLEPHKDPIGQGRSLPAPDALAARALNAARMLAALHALPAERIGIAAEPELGPADELSRWSRVFATVDADMQPGAEAVAGLLNHRLPCAAPACLVHGDFRLGNLLCRGAEPVAIVDWEIWSRGDPRFDLAWFLLTAEPQVHPLAIRDAPGMPRPDVLLATYQAASVRGVESLEWFRAAALYKMAASVSLIVKHSRRRGDPDGRAAALAPRVATMLDRARTALRDI